MIDSRYIDVDTDYVNKVLNNDGTVNTGLNIKYYHPFLINKG